MKSQNVSNTKCFLYLLDDSTSTPTAEDDWARGIRNIWGVANILVAHVHFASFEIGKGIGNILGVASILVAHVHFPRFEKAHPRPTMIGPGAWACHLGGCQPPGPDHNLANLLRPIFIGLGCACSKLGKCTWGPRGLATSLV